ncbi:hypothetical protein HUJ05_006781 [Dendroctonus ponderosae]|nr:hypothetical protein HUJ05_006781 [Dendroctonus ponderosae]
MKWRFCLKNDTSDSECELPRKRLRKARIVSSSILGESESSLEFREKPTEEDQITVDTSARHKMSVEESFAKQVLGYSVKHKRILEDHGQDLQYIKRKLD